MLQLEAPVNTTAILGQSQQLVPDVATQAAQRQLMQAQAAAANQQLQFRQIALQRQQSFGQDMQNFLQAPNASGVAQLFGKYPEFQQQISDAWNTMDTAQKRSSVSTIGSIIQMAKAGDMEGAANALQQKISADDSAGQDTTVSRQMLAELQSGDPKRVNAAIGTGALVIGAAYPDKAKDFLSSIGLDQTPLKTSPGEKATNPVTGQTVASSPALLTAHPLENADGSQRLDSFNPNPPENGQVNGGAGGAAPPQQGGGGPVSGGAVVGPQAAIATVLHNEGGFNPKDMNGSPTNYGINFKANAGVLKSMGITAANFKNMTADQAAQIYATKYWPKSGAADLPANLQTPYFDVYVRNPAMAKSLLAQSGGDPAQFMALASAKFQSMAANNPKAAPYAAAWANRDANNTAIATGSAPSGGAIPASAGAPAQAVGAPGAGQIATLDSGGSQGLNTKGAEPGYAWNATHTAQIPVPGTPNDPNSYAPQEIDDLARNWIATGPTAFASLGGGMGGGGGIAQLKKAALARATQIMAQSGITADQLPAIRSKFSAFNSSMTQNTQILNMLEASENALHANAQQVLQTQKKLVDSGIISNTSPAINNARLATYGHIGSAQTKADIKAYQDAVNGLTQEYTKFMNSANGMGGNAAPSDTARGLAMDLNDEGQGPATMASHIKQIFIETGNKRAGIDAQNQAIQTKLATLIGGAPQSQQQQNLPAGARVIGTYQGRRVIEVNGQRMVEQ